ncbi:MAG: hypothetical protein ACT4P6_11370 [Gemmatimonadaceae bacterium]
MTGTFSLGTLLLLPAVAASQPSASKAAERAAALPLFASHAPLEIVLTADFRLLSRDRDTLSTKRYPGTLKYVPEGGDTVVVPVELRPRGHFRLLARNCPFVPLRVDFPREKGPDAVAKTPFAGQSGLKLVTHCRNEERYQQIVYREEMVYRVHNLVSPISHRSRLATLHYRDTTGKSLGKFPGFFIEHEGDVARRNGGKIADQLRGALYDDLDPVESVRFAMFAYMIGHTDLSIYALHNVRLIVIEGKSYTPLLYDFDFTGLVNAHYATPDPRLGIRDVRTRLYRGGCTHVQHVPQAASEFLALKAPVLALYDSVTYMDKSAVRDSKYFLNEFFETIANPRDLKSSIIDRCVRNPGV